MELVALAIVSVAAWLLMRRLDANSSAPRERAEEADRETLCALLRHEAAARRALTGEDES
jgi:hypothetical protein